MSTGRSIDWSRTARSLENHHLRSRPTQRRNGRTLRFRWADERPTFVTYIQQCLAPTLAHRDPVIMDNLAAHKVVGVRQAIEAVGARLRYLPQYSPDFNPIEQGFSKVKSKLRKAAERAVKGLCRRIGLISRSFKTQECTNFFRHAGYG